MCASITLKNNGNVLMSCGKEKARGVQKINLGEPEIRQVVHLEYHNHYQRKKWHLTVGII